MQTFGKPWAGNAKASGSIFKLLNRFISAETYRAVAKPNRQTGGEAKPRLRRIFPYCNILIDYFGGLSLIPLSRWT